MKKLSPEAIAALDSTQAAAFIQALNDAAIALLDAHEAAALIGALGADGFAALSKDSGTKGTNLATKLDANALGQLEPNQAVKLICGLGSDEFDKLNHPDEVTPLMENLSPEAIAALDSTQAAKFSQTCSDDALGQLDGYEAAALIGALGPGGFVAVSRDDGLKATTLAKKLDAKIIQETIQQAAINSEITEHELGQITAAVAKAAVEGKQLSAEDIKQLLEASILENAIDSGVSPQRLKEITGALTKAAVDADVWTIEDLSNMKTKMSANNKISEEKLTAIESGLEKGQTNSDNQTAVNFNTLTTPFPSAGNDRSASLVAAGKSESGVVWEHQTICYIVFSVLLAIVCFFGLWKHAVSTERDSDTDEDSTDEEDASAVDSTYDEDKGAENNSSFLRSFSSKDVQDYMQNLGRDLELGLGHPHRANVNHGPCSPPRRANPPKQAKSIHRRRFLASRSGGYILRRHAILAPPRRAYPPGQPLLVTIHKHRLPGGEYMLRRRVLQVLPRRSHPPTQAVSNQRQRLPAEGNMLRRRRLQAPPRRAYPPGQPLLVTIHKHRLPGGEYMLRRRVLQVLPRRAHPPTQARSNHRQRLPARDNMLRRRGLQAPHRRAHLPTQAVSSHVQRLPSEGYMSRRRRFSRFYQNQ